MAQSYFPDSGQTTASPLLSDSSKESRGSEKQHMNADDVQETFIARRDGLLEAVDLTTSILGDLQTVFSKENWVVRYPIFSEKPQQNKTEPEKEQETTTRRKTMRRSLSFADDPKTETEVVIRNGLNRSVTLPSLPEAQAEEKEEKDDESPLESSDFHVLRLDLKLGHHNSANSPTALVTQLEKDSIATLLGERITTALAHIDKLRLRIQDTSSKVLVTGDLNAGKSTFVNALLRREVMPVDQQPCTTAFCEVHDAAENDGKEEVHIIKDGSSYSVSDESTFTRASLQDLEEIVAENENSHQILRVYLADSRPPVESLLNNGVVDISLIDAPGLNRDSIKTTALFARQEEIDVVVFVVSAENHFTLSAKEFLWNASNEKAYLFIVVNKFEQIKNKEKCRRLVLDQIKQLSPRTFDDAEDLVHFVDSASVMSHNSENPAFDNLESSLRSFVLVKRAKSKLMPASTYLTHILSDLDLLVGSNAIVAESELERAKEDLGKARPVLEKMKSGREALEENLEAVEEDGANKASVTARRILTDALDRVGDGKLGVDKPIVNMPSYPGLLGVWDFAREVRRALLASLDVAVKLAEDEARGTATTGVNKISQLGDQHLPEGVERNTRVFVPEAMFAARRGAKKGRRSSGIVVAGGTYGLGIGLAQRPDLLDTTFFDLFDVHHQFSMHFGDGKAEVADDEEANHTALSVVSVGIGALTLVGGKTFGARTLIEGIVRVSELLSNESVRKWAAPVIGAFAIGATAYFVLELPNTIPRTVGRRIKASLVKPSGDVLESQLFANEHSARISRETRKVLRLASWDLKERFRVAMDERGKEVKDAEETEKKAMRALGYFQDMSRRTGEVREKVRFVGSL
ncbi:hypothetical protein JAAARDRAFT_29952 [Jaapia argillacea MUCL 33604]|uniref:Dynamin-type G domain-containing protein n=1 Tax=Jaapia argillacea MUCL 33604 TaxID=933084 RepID=A0A067QEX5_9AGAM|nr:hypothetical protein JAAARDRAFT_29952 [Jaapia argillacea MUCL 33604]